MMIDKLKSLLDNPRLHELQDMRTLGQLAFLVVALMVTWSGVKVIQTNYVLQQQISRQQQEVAVQQLKNENMKLRNEYYNTAQYLELSARYNFGLAAPGEKVLLVPKKVALAYAPDVEIESPRTATTEPNRPFYRKNIQAWIDFFMHRQQGV